jgi:hypothetical protein
LASNVTVDGLHVAFADACALQLVWQVVSPVHTGAMSSVSHFGSAYVPVQPPLHLMLAPQLTFAPGSSLHSPLHLPLQLDAHLPVQFAVAVHFEHFPSQVPSQAA